MKRGSKNKPENVAIGEAISRARELAGLTQAELAEKMGVKQQSVGEWERGKTAPRAARLAQLSKFLPDLRNLRKEMEAIPHAHRSLSFTDIRFSLTESDFQLLNADQQQHVTSLIGVIEETVKRAGKKSGRLKPAMKSYGGHG